MREMAGSDQFHLRKVADQVLSRRRGEDDAKKVVRGAGGVVYEADLNACYSARAAATSKTSTPDGITLATDDILLVVSGGNKGVWKFKGGSSYVSLGLYKAVAVREGTTYGRRLMVYDSTTTTYKKNYAVFSA